MYILQILKLNLKACRLEGIFHSTHTHIKKFLREFNKKNVEFLKYFITNQCAHYLSKIYFRNNAHTRKGNKK